MIMFSGFTLRSWWNSRRSVLKCIFVCEVTLCWFLSHLIDLSHIREWFDWYLVWFECLKIVCRSCYRNSLREFRLMNTCGILSPIVGEVSVFVQSLLVLWLSQTSVFQLGSGEMTFYHSVLLSEIVFYSSHRFLSVYDQLRFLSIVYSIALIAPLRSWLSLGGSLVL